MLDQDVAEIFTPICFAFWKHIYHTNMRLDLLDCTHSDTVDAQVLITQVGSRPASGDDVDALIIVITVRRQIAFSLDIELAQAPQREGVHHTSSTSRRLRGRDTLESRSPVSATHEMLYQNVHEYVKQSLQGNIPRCGPCVSVPPVWGRHHHHRRYLQILSADEILRQRSSAVGNEWGRKRINIPSRAYCVPFLPADWLSFEVCVCSEWLVECLPFSLGLS